MEFATLVIAASPEPKIDGLSWNIEPLEVQSSPIPDQAPRRYVTVKGEFKKPMWALAAAKTPIKFSKKKSKNPDAFTAEVTLWPYLTYLDLLAISPTGEAKQERASIILKTLDERWATGPPGSRLKHHLSVALFTSIDHFSETGRADFISLVSSSRLNYRYLLLPGKAELVGEIRVSIMPWFEVPAHPDGRTIATNARATYRLPWIKNPFRLHAQAGWHFKTMFVSQYAYGYAQWAGPLLFPMLEYRRPNGAVHSISARVVPVFGFGEILALKNREFGFSYSWSQISNDGNPVSIEFVFEDLQLVFENASTRIDVHSQSYGLGLSYGF